MTKPKDDDVKRYWVEHGRGRLTAIYEEKVDGLDDDAFEVVRAADHDRKVAELEDRIERMRAPRRCGECGNVGMMSGDAPYIDQLATARKVIEKLRDQRNTAYVCSWDKNLSKMIAEDDAEIEAIERGDK